jgi:sortase A
MADRTPNPVPSSPLTRGEGGRAAPTRRRWAVYLVPALLIGFGLWQVGEGLLIHAKAALAQVLIARAWDETVAGGRPARPWPWADTYPVARLEVDALGVERMVLAGASGRTLAFGPGHMDGSPLPGAPGNSVIGGHRDTHLRFLEDVTPGMVIRIETADGAWHRFRVVAARIADSRTTRLALTGGPPRLTLVTCYPFDAIAPGGPLRYVVTAEEIADRDRVAAVGE